MEDNTGQNYPSSAMVLLTKRGLKPLQEKKEGTWGAKELKKNLDTKTVLVFKAQKLCFFSLF